MSVFKKIKDVLFDVDEEEEEVVTPPKKVKPVYEDNPIKEVKMPSEVHSSLDNVTSDVPKTSSFNFPLDFDDDIPAKKENIVPEKPKDVRTNRDYFDDDYDFPRRSRSDYSASSTSKKKDDVRDYSKYLQSKKEEKKAFTPSPVISPVYGVLNQNYTKDDVIVRTENGIRTPSLDEVREKAYNKKKAMEKKKEVDEFEEPLKTLDEILINNTPVESEFLNTDSIEEELKNDKTTLEDDLLFADEEIMSNEADLNTDSDNEIVDDNDDLLENDLFNLIDSMYESNGEEEED